MQYYAARRGAFGDPAFPIGLIIGGDFRADLIIPLFDSVLIKQHVFDGVFRQVAGEGDEHEFPVFKAAIVWIVLSDFPRFVQEGLIEIVPEDRGFDDLVGDSLKGFGELSGIRGIVNRRRSPPLPRLQAVRVLPFRHQSR